MKLRETGRALLCLLLIPALSSQSRAYGPIGHMRVVIENWKTVMAPNLGPESILDKDLVFAAFAGALSSDIGYVIDNGRPFTDAIHYVRSGDYVTAIVQKARSSHDARLLAFALGAQTHYWADRFGHDEATNRLVANVTNAPIKRVTYERDACAHTWVETRLSLIDRRDIPDIFDRGFTEAIVQMHGEPNSFVQKAYALISDAVKEVYLGTELSFSATDLYRYYRVVAISQSLTEEMAGKIFPNIKTSKSMESTRQLSQASNSHGDEVGALNTIWANLTRPLPVEDDILESIYHESLQAIAKNMQRSSARLTNFNLDTNLPSESGQYVCADVAFYSQAAPLPVSTNMSSGNAVKEFQKVYSNYWNDGQKTRELLTRPIGADPENTLLSNVDLTAAIEKLLTNIDPPRSNSKNSLSVHVQRPCADAGIQYQFGAQIFVVDVQKSTLCVSDKARTLEFLYGYAVAQDIISTGKQTSVNINRLMKNDVERITPRYLEARERTRVDEDVSSYPHRNCPNCEHRAQQ